mmetsp:Transcript_21637/g.55274  ORF Transcript_21637/g.55274 Transcript_21637/m.55274 type:complete len:108 (-) Transcript_21637:524-847(-)
MSANGEQPAAARRTLSGRSSGGVMFWVVRSDSRVAGDETAASSSVGGSNVHGFGRLSDGGNEVGVGPIALQHVKASLIITKVGSQLLAERRAAAAVKRTHPQRGGRP